ncbi:MAG: cysteine hydrolase [Clostridia bacterium]|nr:cysteine hydrolase [Clostridia bacterium]
MNKLALLVVDVQNGLVSEGPYEKDEVISNIKKLQKACRDNSVEVIFVQHDEKEGGLLEPGKIGWQIYFDIKPEEGEKVFRKRFNSAFRETDLKEYLDSQGITQLIITGMQTEYCIDTTVKVAFEYGYELFIPEKTNTTFDSGNIKAKDLIELYNDRIFNWNFAEVVSIEKIIAMINER